MPWYRLIIVRAYILRKLLKFERLELYFLKFLQRLSQNFSPPGVCPDNA